MARPLRRLWKERPLPRRRHRTWMFSMSMASLGWAAIWIDVLLLRWAPRLAPSLPVAAWIACGFAVVGFAAVLWGIRARRAWLVMLLVPLVANGALLAAPWVLSELRLVAAERPHAP